jgi:hypothetical protein
MEKDPNFPVPSYKGANPIHEGSTLTTYHLPKFPPPSH